MIPPSMPPMPPSPQAFEDASHLRMLAIAHYICAGLTAFFSCFTLIYIFIGGAIVFGKFPKGPAGASSSAGSPDQWMGGLFLGIGLIGLVFGMALAVGLFLTGRWLSARKHPTFCFVVACIECINMPLGTVLGIFTIIVLNRPSVRALFIEGPAQNNFSHH